MATALIGGLVKRGFAPDSISVVEVAPQVCERLAADFGVRTAARAGADLAASDVVLLAVKPQQLQSAVANMTALLSKQLVISIAAGIRTAALTQWLQGYTRIVRAMPNMPALIGAGISALYATPTVSAPQRQAAEDILRAVGLTLWIEREDLMDAVTAVSGSGPAYVFYFLEALEQAAQELGIEATAARQLSLQTFLGAAQLATNSGEDPATLRVRVTSPGGTTERALKTMDAEALKQRFIESVKQAAARSRELGDELGGGQ